MNCLWQSKNNITVKTYVADKSLSIASKQWESVLLKPPKVEVFIIFRALSMRPKIPVSNSEYFMWRMEQHFPVGCTNPIRVVTFMSFVRKYKRNHSKTEMDSKRLLLALKMFDDCEVETNDILNEDDDMLHVKEFKSSPRLV